MKDINNLIILYDCYSELLTDNQKKYFEDYYFSNYSLSEIALNYNVSRNAVYKQLKLTKEKLVCYEKKLKLNEKYNKILKILKNYPEIKNKIIDIL